MSLKLGKMSKITIDVNRKSHTRFRLVPKSTTSDDLKGPLCTLFQNAYVFRSTPQKFE